MKTKSLLLGSAAALFAVTGARAADAVIIPEPEVVEYVRVCDAAGTGFFYIPGTETCLKISGYVQMDFEFAEGQTANDWDYEARVAFESWTDSEYGPVTTMIRTTAAAPAHEPFNVYVDANAPRIGLGFEDATSSLNVDRAYFEIAGLRMGLDASAFDFGISGELDDFGNGRPTGTVRYTATVGATSIFLSLEEDSQHGIRSFISGLNGGTFPITTGPFADLLDEDDWMPNIVGGISGSFGDLSYTLAAVYDPSTLRTAANATTLASILGSYGSAWSVKGTASYAGFNLGAQYTSNADLSARIPGAIAAAAFAPATPPLWATTLAGAFDTSLDSNSYQGPGEWYVAASYDWQASDKLLVTPAVHYANDTNFKLAGSPSVWGVGLTAKYDITDTLWVRGHIEYNDPSASDGTWNGQIRFRAEF